MQASDIVVSRFVPAGYWAVIDTRTETFPKLNTLSNESRLPLIQWYREPQYKFSKHEDALLLSRTLDILDASASEDVRTHVPVFITDPYHFIGCVRLIGETNQNNESRVYHNCVFVRFVSDHDETGETVISTFFTEGDRQTADTGPAMKFVDHGTGAAMKGVIDRFNNVGHHIWDGHNVVPVTLGASLFVGRIPARQYCRERLMSTGVDNLSRQGDTISTQLKSLGQSMGRHRLITLSEE